VTGRSLGPGGPLIVPAMLLDDLEADPRPPVARLAEILRKYESAPDTGRQLAEAVASGSPTLERAGAWLLRRWAARTPGVAATDWAVVLDALPGVRRWEARLLLCQLLAERPGLADGDRDAVAAFVRAGVGDRNPFLRAWAITALHAIAVRHPELRAEARRRVAAGRRDPAASVRARMRRLEAFPPGR